MQTQAQAVLGCSLDCSEMLLQMAVAVQHLQHWCWLPGSTCLLPHTERLVMHLWSLQWVLDLAVLVFAADHL